MFLNPLSRRLVLLVVSVLAFGCRPTGPVVVTPNVGDNGALAFQPTGPYDVGTRVTLTASPAPGFVVDSWTGTDDDASKSSINHVTISEKTKKVTVNFVVATGGPFHLTLPVSVDHGTLTAAPVEPTNGYPAGTRVVLTATPDEGYTLDAWTGTDDSTSTSLTNQMTMIDNETVGVSFKAAPGGGALLTLNAVGAVTLATTSSVPSQPGPTYLPGTVVSLTATLLNPGHKVLWTHTDNDALTTATNTVTMGSNPVTVTAASACDTQCTLTVLVDFPAFGHVVVSDPQANLQRVTQGTVTAVQTGVNDSVTLMAHDSANWPFQGWASPAAPANGTCTGIVAMHTDQTVSASFPDLPGQPSICP
jgi:hypothetical protein